MTENVGSETTRVRRSSTAAVAPSAGGLLEFAGYALLLYGLYSLIVVMLAGEGLEQAVWARMAQILSLFPVLFLAPVLIFSAPETRVKEDTIWRSGVRWLVMLLSITFLLQIPVALINEFNTNQRESNKITRLETMLQKRRKEITNSMGGISSAADFERVLKRYPEISNINIVASETADKIRANIDRDISVAINQQVNQLLSQNQQRVRRLSANVRNLCLGSLIAGLSMLSLASRIVPWLSRLSQAQANTARGFGKVLSRAFGWLARPVQLLQRQLRIMQRDLLGLLPGARRPRKRASSSSKRSRERR